ncbi:Intraflagellar transport protein 81-like protein [Frankliniella fusca]|uniref:Intraflagellar transport protein 81 homolog n=1 Tax=Frankliniella fusca TaxID=407009 RepID=A0AAE1GUH1_9NEOP|nr:Intraflagellar transport protein 81-like protein [Frankliniella fusca]
MSDQLKFIVEHLNDKPFNKNFNLISFDSSSPDQLLQVVSDVLAEMDPSHSIDIRTEEPEATTLRILNALRILKYKPPPDITLKAFGQGIVQGDKLILHPVLEWLLHNMEDLRKRTYLAKFLVKLEVPPDILGDADIAAMYEQYENLIEEFKLIHKETETVKNSGYSVGELKSDMEAMEKERDIVLNRIQQVQRKVEGSPSFEAMLHAAHELRIQREREKELINQQQDEESALSHRDQRLQRLQQQLKDLRHASVGATPQGLLQRLEEETSVNSYIAKQKLPREIEAREQEVAIMSAVIAEPAMGRSDLDALNSKLQAVNSEISQLVQRHLATKNPAEDKLAPFRQQAAIIARKKDSTAEQLAEMRSRVAALEEELQEKQSQLQAVAGDAVLRGEEFKRYVSKLRGRSSLYKRHRSQLSALKAESGVLSWTVQTLKLRTEKTMAGMEKVAAKHGMLGILESESLLDEMALQKNELDMVKGQSLEQISGLVLELREQIASRKAQLAPIIKELRPLREKCKELTSDYDQAKQKYDAASAGFDSSIAKLEQETNTLQAERDAWESECQILEAKCVIMATDLERVAEEIRLYKGGDSAEKGKTSVRELLGVAIAEREKQSRTLKEEQKAVQEVQINNQLQKQLWSQIQELMEAKLQCYKTAKEMSGTVTIEQGSETLVLQ